MRTSPLTQTPIVLMAGAVLAAVAAAPTARGATVPAGINAAAARAIPTQQDGRWPPLDTVARSTVRKVTGTIDFAGADAVLVLLGWTIDPQNWMHHPLIPVRNAELRQTLSLPADQEVFSYVDLIEHRPLFDVLETARNMPRGQKLDPLQSKASSINEKLGILSDVFRGELVRIVPDPADPNGVWRSIAALRQSKEPHLAEAQKAWQALEQAYLRGDAGGFATAATSVRDALAALPAGHRPTDKLIATELRMNRLRPFTTAWQIMVLGVLLAGLSLLLRNRWIDFVTVAVMIGGFAVLTYGLSLRWIVAGRIPASNMYESLLFLSWGAGPIAILTMMFFKNRTIPLTSSFMGALSLYLADSITGLDPFIRPILPVLMDTVWMSIHVPVIMVSYFVLALAMLIAHGQLVVLAVAPHRKAWSEAVDQLHYWYMHIGSILLMVGIVTGSMWAASSWGRYWGWDPKEVWSLIALLGYLTILHVRVNTQKLPNFVYALGAVLVVAVFGVSAQLLAPVSTTTMLALAGALVALAYFVFAQGPFATAVKSITAFWGIVMTYVGVNYVLGTGLHSYGFGTGAVKKYMFLTGGIDLAFVAFWAAVYLARSRAAQPAARPVRR